MADPQPEQQQPKRTGWGGMITQVLLMYTAFAVMRGMSAKPAAAPGPALDGAGAGDVAAADEWPAEAAAPQGAQEGAKQLSRRRPSAYRNAYPDGLEFTLRVWLSNSDEGPLESDLVWEEAEVFYDWQESNVREKQLTVSGDLLGGVLASNDSIFAHIEIEPALPAFAKRATIRATHPMLKYKKPKVVAQTKNLLTDEDADGPAPAAALPAVVEDGAAAKALVPHWKPTLMLHLVHDLTTWPASSMPPQIKDKVTLDERRGQYLPILYVDEFWLMDKSLMPVNFTLSELPLTLSYDPIGQFKFFAQAQMEEQWSQPGLFEDEDAADHDIMRAMLMDTHPALLAVTVVVSLLHTVFDMLAFKNDISFWKNNKNLEGLSIRTIGVNIFFSVVILLYLIDNDASFMILFSSGIGLLIEVWKIRKAVRVQIVWPAPGAELFPRIKFEPIGTYAKSMTRQYDEIAVSHLTYVAYPLVVGFAAYSLLYVEHKGWYSWVISSMCSFIYLSGMIWATPQLFINYKLKSVAHLPWRSMVYKSLNTFIDDLFAFIIPQPTMHRLACFRDDVIFFIYLYQRWIYPVDKKRINEFGQCEEPTEEMLAAAAKKKEAAAAAGAAAKAGGEPAAAVPADDDADAEQLLLRQRRRGKRDKVSS